VKEPDWQNCTEEQLWKFVASHLASNGIDTILVGGAVVSIYTGGAYKSGDLDLVLTSYLSKKLPEAMARIGFKVSESRHYSHPKCRHIIVEFASPPAAIGDDYKIQPDEIKYDGQIIRLYSPTDCIRDRLASYIHFSARECLDQAVLVGTSHPFDLRKVQKWCREEGAASVFDEFTGLLGRK
jgi:hypothetical protein